MSRTVSARGLTVSPDGATVYLAASASNYASRISTVAYDTAGGARRWVAGSAGATAQAGAVAPTR